MCILLLNTALNSPALLLDEAAQALEGAVPVRGDLVEVGAGARQARWLEHSYAVASALAAADQASLLEHAQVLATA